MKIKKCVDFKIPKTKSWLKLCFWIGMIYIGVFIGGVLITVFVAGIWAMTKGAWAEGLIMEAVSLFLCLMLSDMYRSHIIAEPESVLCVDYFMGFCRRRRFAYKQIDVIQKEYYRYGERYCFYNADGKKLFWINCSKDAERVFGKYVADKRKY